MVMIKRDELVRTHLISHEGGIWTSIYYYLYGFFVVVVLIEWVLKHFLLGWASKLSIPKL